MGFFNKKEEVLEFKLTNYGKSRLAAGKLKPAYYAFFDDDVLYDASAAGFTETQNDGKSRIQSNTPKMRVLTTREGAETRVTRFIDQVSSSFNSTIGGHTSDPADYVEFFQQQPYGDKGTIDAYPLGSSNLIGQNVPAWQLNLLSTPSSSLGQSYLNDDDFIQQIPQIDITIDYETFYKKGKPGLDAITGYLNDKKTISLALKENYLLLELLEENTLFEKENFEIEVYLSSSTGYTQMSYTPASTTEFIASTDKNIEYYINVLVDEEVPPDVLEDLDINPRALTTNASRLKLNRDIYSTENEEPC